MFFVSSWLVIEVLCPVISLLRGGGLLSISVADVAEGVKHAVDIALIACGHVLIESLVDRLRRAGND